MGGKQCGRSTAVSHSQKREANEREEELCWGRDVLPKKYDGNGRRLYFNEQSLMYLSGDTSREQGVHVRCDLLCPGVILWPEVRWLEPIMCGNIRLCCISRSEKGEANCEDDTRLVNAGSV